MHTGNQSILTFQDYFSKYPEAFLLMDRKATTIAKIFVNEIICRHGTSVPCKYTRKITHGSGSEFYLWTILRDM